MSIISLIAAMTPEGVIGLDNKIPWYIKADLQHFKRHTLGKPLLVGRKTFESLAGGKPLPGRPHFILTRQKDYKVPDCTTVHSLSDALEATQEFPELMVIGGADIYQQCLPLAHRFYLSTLTQNYSGDTFFPNWDRTKWHCQEKQTFPEFSFQLLTKIIHE